MKTILIILDGVSEKKIEELNFKTPLEYADTPTLDKILQTGTHIKTTFYPKNKNPDSLNCILSMLGVDENLIPKNRAYLEALAANINIEDDEAVLRCNLINADSNKLNSFNAGGLTNGEMKETSLRVKNTKNIKFYHISDYRNLLVVKKNQRLYNIKNLPPHEHVGSSMDYMMSCIKEHNVLNEFAEKNKFKIKNSSYMFYPWGVSEKVKLPTFKSLHNKTCSVVCSAEIVKGIAKAMHMDVQELNHSTGDVDTDLNEKAEAVLKEIKSHDAVIAHINGTDEISHRKDLDGKIKFIEKIDHVFLSKIYKSLNDTCKIVIASDHQTSSVTGKHEKGEVDVILNRGETIWQKL